MIIKTKDPSTGELQPSKIPVFKGDDKISGRVEVRSRKKFEHLGIKVELVGMIEVSGDVVQSSTFMSNGLDLEPPGTKGDDQVYNFSFAVFQKPYESYYGATVKLRYFIRATIQQSKYRSPIVKELDIGVSVPCVVDDPVSPINLEVGIDDYLNIKIDFPRNTFDLKEVVEGKISFLLVKLLIKKMDLILVRKEIVGTGEKATISAEDIFTFEIMDGCPIKGQLTRRRNSGAGVPRRHFRPDPHSAQPEQQVLGEVLPEHRNHRRNEPKVLQKQRDKVREDRDERPLIQTTLYRLFKVNASETSILISCSPQVDVGRFCRYMIICSFRNDFSLKENLRKSVAAR